MTLLRIVVLALLTQVTVPQQPAPASVQGVIRESGTGRALENVTLELRRLDGPAPYLYSRRTSGDGAFEFMNVAPGDYRLVAKRAGYVSWEYGQHGWNGSGAPFHVAAGESKKNIRFQLTPGASISGRITDKDGDTGAIVGVQAIAVSNRTGHRTYQVVQSTYTNDLGEYRFFELHPGKYLLSATTVESSTRLDFLPNNAGASLISPSTTLGLFTAIGTPSNGPAPVFYPGTADPRAASDIEVTPGTAVRGGNFAVFPVQTRHVRGIVQGADAAVQLIARTPAPGSPATVRGMKATAGAFDFGDVAPGEYLLIAQWVDQKATMKVDVHDADISNLILELHAGILLPAHVRIAGRATAEAEPAYPYIKFNLSPDPAIEALPIPTTITFPDGSVNFLVMPGENSRIALANVPGAPAEFQNVYIQSIQMGSHDVLNGGLHFTGEDGARMEIVIGTGAGSLTGTVVDDRQDASINTSVVLIPDVARRGRADAYKSAITDAAGRFQIGQIPPGDYLAFAWDEVEDGEWRDPDFIRQYERRGAPVHIEEFGKAVVALQVIP